MQVLDYRINKRNYTTGYLSKPDFKNKHEDIKRPLKQNQTDLSFKGFFLKKPDSFNIEDFIKFYKKYIGSNPEKHLENLEKRTKGMIKNNGSKIEVREKTIPQLALDGMLYPFRILPADMLRGAIGTLGKLPGLGKWSENVLSKDAFKTMKANSEFDTMVNSLSGMITFQSKQMNSALEKYAKEKNIQLEKITDDVKSQIFEKVEKEMANKVFVQSMKSFDPKTGNYDTKHERSLNRVVSGFPPAIFLANDAYNLSRMMDDDSESAKNEQKTRFKQETSRILSNAYLTLITMGAFQNFINKSKFGIALTTGLTVLVTEMFSRLSNGKHITRLTSEKAKEINKSDTQKSDNTRTKETNYIKELKDNHVEKPKNAQVQTQKPLLSFDTLLKASAVVIATGYGIRGLHKLPFIEKAAKNYFTPEKLEKLGMKASDVEKGSDAINKFYEKVIFKPFTDKYKNLTSEKDYIAKNKDMQKVANYINDAGFESLSNTMKSAITRFTDEKGIVHLGSKNKPIKPLVDFVIAPFKFIGKAVSLPYRLVKKVEDVIFSVKKNSSSDLEKSVRSALSQSYDRIVKFDEKLKKQYNDEKIRKEKLEEFIKTNIIKSFNSTSMSGVSNAELSNLAKTAASIATIWFLMTDNYNMVMLKSNGEDKQGAETKFKERFVQETSRLFYQTLLIDLFNSTFRNQYNSSLLGMSWITLTNTFLGEMLTRSSVGTPLKPHTRDELIQIENEQINSTGLKKKYYNFMQRLTGKRPIKTYEVSKKN